ncbi:M48 family metallopeptidase [Burkholderiaceae bacterium DAT-1]|nr:M48 family metallopeptidase [Burkholderiaceae bacterium DAT-1]
MTSSAVRRAIELGGQSIEYTVERRSRRSIGLMVDASGLRVAVPARFPMRDLDEVLHSKARWILDRLARREALVVPQITFGATVDWLGSPMRIVHGKPVGVDVPSGEIRLSATSAHSPAQQLQTLMQREARVYLRQRLDAIAAERGLTPKSLALTGARGRWGSCSASGAIRLNWRLMQAPKEVIDYVVVHELCHLAELNHSPRFWALVESACPAWKQHRQWLKTQGARYFFE